MFYISLDTFSLAQIKNVVGVTKQQHQVQLQFWDPLPTLESDIEGEGVLLSREMDSLKNH